MRSSRRWRECTRPRSSSWQSTCRRAVGSDAPAPGADTYGLLRVYPDRAALPVHGAVLVTPHDSLTLKDDLACGPTVGLTSALNPASLRPSGAPRAWMEQGHITFTQLLTAPAGQPWLRMRSALVPFTLAASAT